MSHLAQSLAVLAILANAVIYGTDVFGAIIQRPALAAVDDLTLTQIMGQIHRIADRRLAAVTVAGLITAAATTALAAVGGHWLSATTAAIATLAVVAFVTVYMRVSQPVNAVLTAAAINGTVPADARRLQTRWDSVINARAGLQTLSLLALCIALVAA